MEAWNVPGLHDCCCSGLWVWYSDHQGRFAGGLCVVVGCSFSFSDSTFDSVVVVVDVVLFGGALVVVVVLVVVVGGLVWGLVTNAVVGLVGFAVDVVVFIVVEDGGGCSSQEPEE